MLCGQGQPGVVCMSRERARQVVKSTYRQTQLEETSRPLSGENLDRESQFCWDSWDPWDPGSSRETETGTWYYSVGMRMGRDMAGPGMMDLHQEGASISIAALQHHSSAQSSVVD
jgi:hypothetical protein